jgi:hypothetical protein
MENIMVGLSEFAATSGTVEAANDKRVTAFQAQ